MEEQQVPSNMYGWYLEERERGRKREREMIIVHRLAERSEGWSEGWRKGGERERERERESPAGSHLLSYTNPKLAWPVSSLAH